MNAQTKRKAVLIAFCFYAAVMIWLLFLQRIQVLSSLPYLVQLKRNCNLVPLKTILSYLHTIQNSSRQLSVRTAFFNLLGNVLLFVPLGCFLPALWPGERSFPRFLATVVSLICLIELVQLLALLGSCDIDDLLLNTSGCIIGFLFWKRHAAAAETHPSQKRR